MTFSSPANLIQHLAGRLGLVAKHVAGEPEADRERDETLLGAVVQVALELAALSVPAGHDPGAGLAQRLGLRAQLVERVLQSRVELGVVERKTDLAGQVGQHAVVLVGEAVTGGRALDDDEPEQLPGVADRGHPQLGRARDRRAARAARPWPRRCPRRRPW